MDNVGDADKEGPIQEKEPGKGAGYGGPHCGLLIVKSNEEADQGDCSKVCRG